MNTRLVCSALMIGIALALATSSGRALAQRYEANVSAPSASQNVGATKNRHWRHRGGRHPHFGSRRLRKPES